jgi:hypothetical protein
VNLRKHNEDRFKIQTDNANVVTMNNRIRTEIQNLKDKQQALRDKYAQLSSGACPTCGQKTSITAKQLEDINTEGKALGQKIKTLEESINNAAPKEIPEAWPERTIEEKAKFLKLKLIVSSQEDIDKVNEYNAAKNELDLKQKQLKSLGELDDKTTLATIKSTKTQFTKELEEKVKRFGLEIELFKELASGETTESFVISFDGKPYSELSGGNRLLVQLRMAMVFVKELGLDFILLDEAGLISQKNYDIIAKECEGIQVIMARATPFEHKDSSLTEKKPKKKK